MISHLPAMASANSSSVDSKKAATEVLDLQQKIVSFLAKDKGAHDPDGIAAAIGTDDAETIYKLCMHLSANGRQVVRDGAQNPAEPWTARFRGA